MESRPADSGEPPPDVRFDETVPVELHTDDAGPESTPVTVACPRCRQRVMVEQASCPHCGAVRRRPVATREAARQIDAEWKPWKILLIGYAASLLAFLMFALIVQNSPLLDLDDDLTQLKTMYVVDVIYAAIVVTCFYALRTERAVEMTPKKRWWVVWPAAFAGLAVMLAANFSYHNLMEGMGLELIELIPEDTSYWWWWAATICVQPAIVEELFFRGCCWRVMTPVMGVHTTVLVSSIMFGMAHIGVPLSMPILAAVGLLLGYARAWSGSLWLPMILHFLHNLVVILW
jgi:uncharacterized protein